MRVKAIKTNGCKILLHALKLITIQFNSIQFFIIYVPNNNNNHNNNNNNNNNNGRKAAIISQGFTLSLKTNK
jgi:hypothetical protein